MKKIIKFIMLSITILSITTLDASAEHRAHHFYGPEHHGFAPDYIEHHHRIDRGPTIVVVPPGRPGWHRYHNPRAYCMRQCEKPWIAREHYSFRGCFRSCMRRFA